MLPAGGITPSPMANKAALFCSTVDTSQQPSKAANRDRSGDRRLALELAVGQGGVVGSFDVGAGAAGILQRLAHGFTDQVVERAVEQAAKGRHADAGDVDVVHVGCSLS